MKLNVNLDDRLVSLMSEDSIGLEQKVIEGLIIRGYVNAELSLGDVKDLLGYQCIDDAQDWLHARGVVKDHLCEFNNMMDVEWIQNEHQHDWNNTIRRLRGTWKDRQFDYQELKDDANEKTTVVLPMHQYKSMLETIEDLEDSIDVVKRMNEDCMSHEEFLEELKRDGLL